MTPLPTSVTPRVTTPTIHRTVPHASVLGRSTDTPNDAHRSRRPAYHAISRPPLVSREDKNALSHPGHRDLEIRLSLIALRSNEPNRVLRQFAIVIEHTIDWPSDQRIATSPRILLRFTNRLARLRPTVSRFAYRHRTFVYAYCNRLPLYADRYRTFAEPRWRPPLPNNRQHET